MRSNIKTFLKSYTFNRHGGNRSWTDYPMIAWKMSKVCKMSVSTRHVFHGVALNWNNQGSRKQTQAIHRVLKWVKSMTALNNSTCGLPQFVYCDMEIIRYDWFEIIMDCKTL